MSSLIDLPQAREYNRAYELLFALTLSPIEFDASDDVGALAAEAALDLTANETAFPDEASIFGHNRYHDVEQIVTDLDQVMERLGCLDLNLDSTLRVCRVRDAVSAIKALL